MNYSINDELRNKVIDKNNIENTICNLDQLEEDERTKVLLLFLSDYFKLKIFNYIENKDFESLNSFINSIEDIKQVDIFIDDVFVTDSLL